MPDSQPIEALADRVEENTEQSLKLTIALTENTRAINELTVAVRAMVEAAGTQGDDD